MLRGLKKASANWFGKIILGGLVVLLVVSFAVWGIGDIFKGFGQSALAKIGRTEIGIDQFRQIYTERLQQLSREIGRPVTMDQARTIGFERRVLGEMIAQTTLDERARELGLSISDEEVARYIMTDPGFRGPSGAFDRQRFELMIRQAGYTEPRFVEEQRRNMLRQQIIDTIAGDLVVPQIAVEAAYRFEKEERVAEYVVLGRAQAGNIPPPSSEDLAKYFEERKGLFRAPEYRKLTLVTLSTAELAKSVEIPDADAKRRYENQRARYAAPERRHLQQIVFPKPEEAQAAAQRIAQGMSFEALAAERGLQTKDIDLGTVAKAAIVDPDIAEAAFALKEGGVSAPVQGRFGTALVRVLKIEPEQSHSYEQAAEEIKRDMALELARGEASALRDRLEDNRAAGDTLAEAAKKINLPVITIAAIDRSGRGLDGAPVSDLPKAAQLVPSAFASDVGVENDPLQAEDGGYLWYDVTDITPSRERTLDEVKNDVEIRWRNDEIAKRLKTKADALVEKLKSGAALKDAAAAERLKVEKTSGLKRGDPTETFSTQAIEAMFLTPKGAPGSAQGEQATQRILFRVTDVTVPKLDMNSDDAKRIAAALRSSLADDLLSQYVARLESEIGVTINPNALSQVIGGETN